MAADRGARRGGQGHQRTGGKCGSLVAGVVWQHTVPGRSAGVLTPERFLQLLSPLPAQRQHRMARGLGHGSAFGCSVWPEEPQACSVPVHRSMLTHCAILSGQTPCLKCFLILLYSELLNKSRITTKYVSNTHTHTHRHTHRNNNTMP